MSAARPPRSIAVLMGGLARLGLLGFGGVGPQAYHVFVERTGWLDADTFAEGYSLAQALPGANVVNLCAIMGDRWFGPVGAVAAVAAITGPPLVVAVVAAAALARLGRAPRFVGAESAIVAASAGLLLATAYRILATVGRQRIVAVALAAAVALIVSNHFTTMPVATVLGIAAGWGVARAAQVRT